MTACYCEEHRGEETSVAAGSVYEKRQSHIVRLPFQKTCIDRPVPRKPRLACRVKCQVYLTGVGGDESAQLEK
jgi:hypothetical protein